jgi:protein-glutamine gamma-glutamyltransferase
VSAAPGALGRPPAVPFRAPAASGPLAAPGRARLLAFFPLALFGAVHWAGLLEPRAGRGATVAVAAATVAGAVLLAVPAIASPRRRALALAGTVTALLVVALLAAGVPPALLVPDRWDDLATGIAEGIGAMVGVTVPYRGVDEWVRITIMLGATLITAAAALVAFWPDRARAPRPRGPAAAGSPLAAAVILGVLYAVPVVQHGPDRPYLDGAVFCLLLGTFLWLERLREDQLGVAAVSLLVAVLAGLIVAPSLDARAPWLDYRQLASSLEAARTSRFDWDHRYGPLNWPREGREVLRIRAAQSAYWKASTLDEFDGVRWRHSIRIPPSDQATEITHGRPDWTQTIRVVVKGLASREFIAAGTTLGILEPSPRPAHQDGPGTFVSAGRYLRRGHSYRARVYVPRPTPVELRAAGESFPAFTYPYLALDLPPARGKEPVDPLTGRPVRDAPLRAQFSPYRLEGRAGRPAVSFPSGAVEARGERILTASAYARTWRLAQSLRAQSTSAYDYVLRVRSRVQLDASYSESPPPSRVPLETFLFDERTGYCQQFSGAMALLLRMGGIPARVASGFSPGRLDKGREEYVVRDLDAHSWVEAYFPGLGWITFDPTPAIAPARSQVGDDSGDEAAGSPSSRGRAGDVPGDVVGGGGAPTSGGGGTDWQVVGAVGVAIVLLLAAGGVAAMRRGRIPGGPLAPELAELQRALHRSGRTPAAPTTLTALEHVLGGSDAARGYLRALRDQRFRGAGGGPTAAQRRALRRELAAGLGVGGRLRAWWALPPRPAR